MKVKSALIKQYRSERLWSQEELATASGLGVRTIQRLESNESGSLESIKALAAVFGIEGNTLIAQENHYKPYKHRQWGYFSIAAIGSIIVTLVSLNYELNILPTYANVLMGIILFAVMVVFSSMTIEVNTQNVTWFFGLGLLRKSVPLQEINHCERVKNPLWMGFGIHSFGDGWIYNVSGTLGVQMTLKSGALIRLGSDEPNYVVQAIEDAKLYMSTQ